MELCRAAQLVPPMPAARPQTHEPSRAANTPADAAAYNASCACTQRLERARADLRRGLKKVLVFDSASTPWNGLGNSLPRWIGLLRLGLTAGRAAFLRFDDRHFDPGYYFVSAAGSDWRWTPLVEAQVRQAMRVGEVVLTYDCEEQTYTCIRPRLCWPHAVDASQPPQCRTWSQEEEARGEVLRWLREHESPWLRVAFTEQTAFEPSYAFAATQLGDSCGAVLDAPMPGARWGSRGKHTQPQAQRCEANGLLRPRRWLASVMAPTLRSLDRFSPLVAIHLRSGFADWQARTSDKTWSKAARLPPLTFDQHWHQLEAFLSECTDPERKDGSSPCFHWHAPHEQKAPTMADSLGCGVGGGFEPKEPTSTPPPSFTLRGAPSYGPLAAAVQCVGRLAEALETVLARRRAACGRRATEAAECAAVLASSATDARGQRATANRSWGVLVVGDTPSLAPLLRMLPQFSGRVVEADEAGALGHTSFMPPRAKAAARGSGAVPPDAARAADPEGAWTRSVVDMCAASEAASNGFRRRFGRHRPFELAPRERCMPPRPALPPNDRPSSPLVSLAYTQVPRRAGGRGLFDALLELRVQRHRAPLAQRGRPPRPLVSAERARGCDRRLLMQRAV